MTGDILSGIFTLLLRTAILGLIGALAALALSRAGAHLRHAVWSTVVAGMLALPLITFLSAPLPLTLPFWQAPAIVVHPLPAASAPAPPAAPAPPPPRPILPTVIFAVWSAGALLLLARQAVAAVRLRRLLKIAQPAALPDIAPLAAALGLRPGALRVRLSPHVNVPFTIGLHRPLLLLPETAVGWPAAKLRAVLAHELAHIARADWLTGRIAAFNRCLYWFHPLAWWLERRLARLAEEAADQTALALTGDAELYAATILDFARALRHGRLQFKEATAMARSTKVGRRLERVLALDQFSPATLGRGAAALILLIAAPLVWAAAALDPQPEPPPPIISVYQPPVPPADPERVAQAEARLKANPDDFPSHEFLINYYNGQRGASGSTRNDERLLDLCWYVVERHPEDKLATVATSIILEVSPSDRSRLTSTWRRTASEKQDNAQVQHMAGVSLTSLSELFEGDEALLRARRLAPNDNRILDSLVMLYAPIYGGRGMAGMNPAFAAHVRDEMNSTSDTALAARVRQQALPGGSPNLRLLRPVTPVYPPLARQARIQGTVRFNAVIGKDGSVKNLTLVSGHPLLVQSAHDAVMQWLFQPALLNGEPTEAKTPIEVNFRELDGSQGAAVAGGVPGGVVGGVPGGAPPPRIKVGGGVQEAMLVEKIQPVYPPLAKQARIQGTVRFNIVIGPEGDVTAIELVSGHPLLVEAAQTAVRQWRYRPTLLNGVPVEVMTTVDVNFTLQQ